ncbi:translation initiation factor eIF 4e-like domain-containing protein [Dimargaris cristalligena]|uniref:Translation initiation factor eIF 4e-like domain-containing protein n=1 Tax=Dimargaris cristalligena TaxID=215637 RepID=A0A4P9ZUJ3_9FUNG|nr:translation initiation factor eIF 4e-like domain-containing protein [Dimargaris cristalligena]|eukprot:RKP37217.1 translation initiation factor eIF 4e-like domain-containing protein [Dimargaris cristalligena]
MGNLTTGGTGTSGGGPGASNHLFYRDTNSGSSTSLSVKNKSLSHANLLPLANVKAGSSSGIHPLQFTWVFWFMHRAPGQKIVNYESAMKKIASFSSIENFWAVYCHLRRPHELPTISDYHLFKQGVRPVWEDDVNKNGGKWIVRLKKGIASRYWEDLVLAVIGDQFDVGNDICGAVLSIRNSEDILSLWNSSAQDGRINLRIRDTVKRILNLPADTIMEYKAHNDSMKDNSSFRNTDVYK